MYKISCEDEEAGFSASNMTLTTQGLTLTTVEPEISVVQSRENRVLVSTTITTSVTVVPPPLPRQDPIAQSIMVTAPEEASGLFVTKVDVYFQAKDPVTGITLLFTEMKSGVPDTARILGQKHLTSAEVNVSEDSSVPTTFVLDDPIFLASGESYAFLVKPDGDSPEYRIWLGETGGYDVITGEQIYQNPYSGMAFVSANMGTWTPIQKEDIKFVLHRANFSLGSYSAILKNETDEFITFSGLLKANSASYISVGDIVYTVNSANVNQVFTGANTSQPYGIVQYVDEPSETVYLDSSSTGWAAGQVIQFHRPTAVGNVSLINTSSKVATANLVSVDDLDYHMVVPRFALMKPARTDVRIQYMGVSNLNTSDASWHNVTNDAEYEFLDTTRIVKSRTNEVLDIGGDTSVNYRLDLSTETPYLSPVLDLRRKSSLNIQNIINNDDTNEANTRYGSAVTKYVSRNVVLDDGQDAEDAVVIVAAYKPVGTSIKVYLKIHNAEDPQAFDDKTWTELTDVDGGSKFSSPMDRRDFVDFQFGIPTTAPATNPTAAYLGADGIVTYTATDGSVYYSYKTFCVKIVLLSDNPARIPLVNDVRILALQV